MKKLLKLSTFICLIFGFSFGTHAIDDQDVEKMVVEFEKSGIIPEEEGQRVREEMRKISPEQWKQIESVAQQYQKQMNSPNVQNDLPNAVHHVNTDSDSFRKISSELEKVMNQRKDLLD
jgi:polyhydroxyalkanoate synthesis regulator phasin